MPSNNYHTYLRIVISKLLPLIERQPSSAEDYDISGFLKQQVKMLFGSRVQKNHHGSVKMCQ